MKLSAWISFIFIYLNLKFIWHTRLSVKTIVKVLKFKRSLLFAMSNKGEYFYNLRFLGMFDQNGGSVFCFVVGFLFKAFSFLFKTFCLLLKTFWGMFDQNGGCCAGNKKPSPSSICATSQNDKKEFHFNVHFQRRTK